MKTWINNHKKLLIDILVLVTIFLFVFLSYLIFKPLYSKSSLPIKMSSDGVVVRVYIYLLLFAIVITGIVLKFRGKLTFHRLLFLIFLVGVVMQLNYMLVTPYNYRQHDVFSSSNAGHEGYAWTIYSTGQLPSQLDSQGHLDYQFYHPPFNALMQAMMMHIFKPFMYMYNGMTGGSYYNPDEMHSLFQTSEILSCFYMNISIYFGIKTINLLHVDKPYRVAGSLFISLFPALFILAGQENNDPLCIMNCFIVMYFTLKWKDDHSYFNAAMIGLFTGLAMFAKLSGALIILPAFIIYLVDLIKRIRNKETYKHHLFQAGVIALLVLPLGLWFHIYAAVRFNQPFGFVFSNLTSKLYVGDHNAFERFINIFDFYDMSQTFWANTFMNYNLPNFLIKSALFGEYSFMHADAMALFTLIFHYLFTYGSAVLIIIYLIVSKKEHLYTKIIMGSLVISQLIAQLYFNIKMPYGCTMDFRYIVPIIIGYISLDVLAFDRLIKGEGWKKYYAFSILLIMGLFLSSSTLFYLFMI
ncbi:MAG: hypothetical protein E7181_00565 [Erysipelotrichaceae bacterium]|nr:hypothetical protein [Erysipelotrichaceae bacterium]